MRMLVVSIVFLGLVEDAFSQTLFDAGIRMAAAADGVNVTTSVGGDSDAIDNCAFDWNAVNALEAAAAAALDRVGIARSSRSPALLSFEAHVFPQRSARSCTVAVTINFWIVVNPVRELLVSAATGGVVASGERVVFTLMRGVDRQVSVIANALRRVRDDQDQERQ